jgi:hypothetical protein
MTPEQADLLISYLNAMSDRTNHQSLMAALAADGISEQELDAACRALGAIAGRECSIL